MKILVAKSCLSVEKLFNSEMMNWENWIQESEIICHK